MPIGNSETKKRKRNDIGYMLDSAAKLGMDYLLVGGHSGKMAKIAAGILQTHSGTADGRREAIITQLALLGAPKELCEQVYACVTTDSAAECIHAAGYDAVWDRLAEAAAVYMKQRTVRAQKAGQKGSNEKGIEIETVITDTAGNILGRFPDTVRGLEQDLWK